MSNVIKMLEWLEIESTKPKAKTKLLIQWNIHDIHNFKVKSELLGLLKPGSSGITTEWHVKDYLPNSFIPLAKVIPLIIKNKKDVA